MYQPWLQRVVDRKIDTETLTKHIDEQDISISLIDMVLAADHGVRTYSRVPTIANEGLIAAVLPALEVLAGAINSGNHKLLTQALQCFLIIPQFALIKAARHLLRATRRATLPQCCNRQKESGKAVCWGRSLTESPRCRC